MLASQIKYFTRIWLSTFISALLSVCMYAQPEPVFQEANAAYEQNDYATAARLYEQILEQGYHSTAVYFNLGNACYEQGQLGRAILYFERALKLSPSDKDVLYNLSLVREQLQDDITQLPPFFLARWWKALRGLGTSGTWSLCSILLLWIGLVGVLYWFFGKSRKQRKLGFLAGMVLILLSIFTGLLAYSQADYERNSKLAIILSVEVELQQAPDIVSKSLLQLHEGTRVFILDEIGDWYKVQLDNGEKGWLPKSSIELV